MFKFHSDIQQHGALNTALLDMLLRCLDADTQPVQMKTGAGQGHPTARNIRSSNTNYNQTRWSQSRLWLWAPIPHTPLHKQGYGTRSRPWTPSSSPQLPAGNSGLPHHPQPVSPPTGGGKRYRIMTLPPEDEDDAGVSQLKRISWCLDKYPVQLWH